VVAFLSSSENDALKVLAEQALHSRHLSILLRFPAALEQRFEQDTRRERSRTLGWFGLLGALTLLLMYPSLLASLPDMQAQSHWLYLGICIPGCVASSAFMLTDPRPVVRETLVACVNAATSVAIMFLFLRGRMADMSVLVSVVFLLIVYSTVGLQLRFIHAVAVVGCILLFYVAGLASLPAVLARTRLDLSFLVAFGGVYALVANRRLEAQARRSYLITLREQLQGQVLERHNQALDELSKSDPLTALANRRAYDLWLARAWAQAEEAGSDLGLIIVDIDKFKAFNDFYGHAAGDSCLQAIARCLGEQLRGTADLVARLGGEEFAVLMPGLGEEASADVAERLRAAVERLELPNLGIGRAGLVTVSAGVATRLAGASTPLLLFEAADAALYGAKRSGRNRVCVSTLEGEVVEERRKVG
jgi:diguanylate cyclase (GGDEF)-like protein